MANQLGLFWEGDGSGGDSGDAHDEHPADGWDHSYLETTREDVVIVESVAALQTLASFQRRCRRQHCDHPGCEDALTMQRMAAEVVDVVAKVQAEHGRRLLKMEPAQLASGEWFVESEWRGKVWRGAGWTREDAELDLLRNMAGVAS